MLFTVWKDCELSDTVLKILLSNSPRAVPFISASLLTVSNSPIVCVVLIPSSVLLISKSINLSNDDVLSSFSNNPIAVANGPLISFAKVFNVRVR